MVYDIEAIEEDFASRRGYQIEKLSHWDCGEAYKRELLHTADFQIPDVSSDYRYSRANERWKALERYFGIPKFCDGIMCANGTSAVNLIVTVLSQLGLKSVLQVDPSYYAMRHSWRALGFETEYVAAPVRDAYDVDESLNLVDVLCVTEPMYSAGTTVSQHTWQLVDTAISLGKTVVVDATLADPDHAKQILDHYGGKIILTTTPHKFIGINDIKCSIVTFDSEMKRAFDQWSGVTSGGLSVSVMAAVDHMTSPNFKECLSVASAWKTRAFGNLCRLTDQNQEIQVLGPPMDHFVGVFMNGIPAFKGRDRAFLQDAFFESGCSFIPQIRNGMTDELGLGLRINLFRWSDRYEAGLSRTLRKLSGSVT